ncbi:MAG TPA: AMP-binding protein, partial [Polyangiaceae bacterium]|nr:AMP-binding protein [Polyangiaceae bacterium]
MNADWFFERLLEWGDRPALVARGQQVSYGELLGASTVWAERLTEQGVTAGSVVGIEGSFSLNACGAFLAAMRLGAVLVPLTPLMRTQREKFLSIAEVTLLIELDAADGFTLSPLARPVTNPLTLKLTARQHPGLVIFSSGST